MIDTAEPQEQPPTGEVDPIPRVVLRPRGWRDLVPFWPGAGRVTLDFERETISRGKTELPFSSIIFAEVRNGILAVSNGKRWICFDTVKYHEKGHGGLLLENGALSERFHRVFTQFQRSVLAARSQVSVETAGEAPRGAADPPVDFDFGYRVRIDFGSIFMGGVGLAIFIGYEQHMGHELGNLIDEEGAWWFLGLLAGFTAWLFFWRWSSRLRVDTRGVHQRRAFIPRSFYWEGIQAVRQQGLEIELQRSRGRIALNLEVLHGRGSPLMIRRGLRPYLTPLGSLFLRWICSRAEQREEVPIFGSRADRLITRLWVLMLFGANIILFVWSEPPNFMQAADRASQQSFVDRLVELGARTASSFAEPWRFFTALFLHGDIVHLGFNLLVLASLAPWIVRIFGVWRASALYLGSGVLGNIIAQCLQLQMGTLNESHVSIGASTAVLGVIGSLLGGIYRRPYTAPLAVRARFRWAIPVVVLLTLSMGAAIPLTDNAAHLGGFLAGFALALIIPPRPVKIAQE